MFQEASTNTNNLKPDWKYKEKNCYQFFGFDPDSWGHSLISH